MTEQSKIPLPSDQDKGGKSLFERAESLFGLGGFQPAPVPKDLVADPEAQTAPAERPTAEEARRETPATEARKVEAPVLREAESEPSPQPVRAAPEAPPACREEPLVFPSARHPIDRAQLREQGMIVPGTQASGLMEEFRIVKRQILLAAREANSLDRSAKAQRVLVSSPLPGEGKTFCAVNLALAIAAEKDSQVLLVDADFAKPSILAVLGLPEGPGLMDALVNPEIGVENCVLGTDVPGFHVLPAGDRTNSDSEFLGSRRTAEVLDSLTRGAPNRIVIFDSPPALAASPAAELAKHVGQTVVVARADVTGQSSLEDALSLLSSCPDIKLLLNAATFSPSGRRFGTYYGYEA